MPAKRPRFVASAEPGRGVARSALVKHEPGAYIGSGSCAQSQPPFVATVRPRRSSQDSMRLLVSFVCTLSFLTSLALAQPAPGSDAGAALVPSTAPAVPPPRALPVDGDAGLALPEATAPSAPENLTSPGEPPPTPIAPPSSPGMLGHGGAVGSEPANAEAPSRTAVEAAHQQFAERVRRADAWIAFEGERDRRTRAAERAFYPLTLGLEAALAGAYAGVAEGVTSTSRVIAGVTAGVTLAAAVPTLLTRDRQKQRAWFATGASLFSIGAGVTLALAPEQRADEHTARWLGASVALQGLAFLPFALIPGFPDEREYQSYLQLPESERADAAARILARIDRFEQRAAAITMTSALLGALVLSAGAVTADNRRDARSLAGLTLAPLGAILLLAPRLFVRGRLDRFSVGDAPTKLPFNGW